ncbi:esterase/lipase family protein [Wukongibacter sp. M2B1]|uniref:esterase/lipase family protein n=1 Tax=Wukongibacter sp. M2B1 TaxID=3088895 RepID=UPI003D798A86
MRMRRTIISICLVLLLLIIPNITNKVHADTVSRENEYPMVLVHGFGGWGRDEVSSIKYWGGISEDIEEILNDYGYTTYTGVVGPYSSNWDRACELYAYIKGGTVDYGKVHSEKYGHERFGRTFSGVYTDWGKVNGEEINKIHLISHSMGGQTVRVLSQLLKSGAEEEIEAVLGENPSDEEIQQAIDSGEVSSLFIGNKSWVHSITTISTPHDGTTMADAVTGAVPFAQQLVALVAAQTGIIDEPIYDFKLDQWGLEMQDDEFYIEYADRVWNSPIWEDTKDISAWELKPDGARELNNWVEAQPDIYYFSWATEATRESIITGTQVGEIGMNALLIPFTLHMGAYTRDEVGSVVINKVWWQNDGVVNSSSMDGPSVGSDDEIVDYRGEAEIGKWNYMGLLNRTDHLDIVGLGTPWKPSNWYKEVVELLGSLPK